MEKYCPIRYNRQMGADENKEIKCPKCGRQEGQMKRGFTGSGSQRYFCKVCQYKYTPYKKRYTEEERKQALRLLMLGNSGRAVGKALNMSKSNAYRWAAEEEKKSREGMDK